jgi:hypothetical protein
VLIQTKHFLLSKRMWGLIAAAVPILAQFFTGPDLKFDVASIGGLMLALYGSWVATQPLSLTGAPKLVEKTP